MKNKQIQRITITTIQPSAKYVKILKQKLEIASKKCDEYAHYRYTSFTRSSSNKATALRKQGVTTKVRLRAIQIA